MSPGQLNVVETSTTAHFTRFVSTWSLYPWLELPPPPPPLPCLLARREPRLRTGGYKVFDLKCKLVGKKTDPRAACTEVYAEVDIQRTLALEESKETSIRFPFTNSTV